MRVVLLVDLDVMLLGGNHGRAGKHHQQKNGGKNLFHVQNLARKQGSQIAPHQKSKGGVPHSVTLPWA